MSDASKNHLAIYPGSFDPVTLGHEDIIRRALSFSERVIVAIAHTRTQPKSSLFSIEERVAMIRDVFADEDRLEVTDFEGLLVSFARERGARLIIRGLRAVSDFEYEFQMALMNRQLWPEVETIFLAPDTQYSFLSASLVREIASLGGDVSELVPPLVLQRVNEKLKR
jgi:pantetheine-phosphate adenylyltransferase